MLSLEPAIELAVRNNLQLKNASLEVNKVEEQLGALRTERPTPRIGPVRTYLCIAPERVERLAAGTYFYDPENHRLACSADLSRRSAAFLPSQADDRLALDSESAVVRPVLRNSPADLMIHPWRLFVSDARNDGSLTRFQGAVVLFFAQGVLRAETVEVATLVLVSQSAIQDESAGERGHHMYGLATHREFSGWSCHLVAHSRAGSGSGSERSPTSVELCAFCTTPRI